MFFKAVKSPRSTISLLMESCRSRSPCVCVRGLDLSIYISSSTGGESPRIPWSSRQWGNCALCSFLLRLADRDQGREREREREREISSHGSRGSNPKIPPLSLSRSLLCTTTTTRYVDVEKAAAMQEDIWCTTTTTTTCRMRKRGREEK